MSEAVETVLFRELPLDAAHRRHGASMAKIDGWLLPVSYGDAGAEYEAVREGGAGVLDLSTRGRIRVSGTEAVQFLNGLITNDVKTLAPQRWMPAAFPNAQGRLLAMARIINRGDSFLIDAEAATYERVRGLLERFTLAGDFRVEDLTSATLMLSVQGPRAGELIGSVLDQETSRLERASVTSPRWRDADLTLIRATHTGEDGFDIFVGAMEAEGLWDALVAAGAKPVGYEALETLRVEAGLPRYQIDMNETNVVLETGLDDAVSFTKGCYIGQEIIARIHWRGHVAKRLAGLSFEGPAEVQPEARVKATDGREIGRITSALFSPRLKRTIALGYLKYDYLAPGTEVSVATVEAESAAARVAELPLVPGGWHKGGPEIEDEG